MSKRFLITIITLIALGIAATVAIFLAKGYTFSTTEKRIVGTGILTVASVPDAASVYIDGHLTTATNTTISSLAPKTYDLKIVKEGFIPWQKQITIKEGLVSEVKVTLFPAIPTMYPLTFNGVQNPTLSPDGEKLAYIVPLPTQEGINQQTSAGQNISSRIRKAGIWVWTQSRNQPISFVRSSEPHQIAQSIGIDFSKAKLSWSSDSKQVLATSENNNYLLDVDRLNSDPRDITAILPATLQLWSDDAKAKDEVSILAIKDPTMRKIASDSADLRWSPDETKFMVVESSVLSPQPSDKTEKAKVYDLEENKQYDLPQARSLIWLPDSRHVILIEDKSISIVDFDGSNKAVIYAGSFLNDFVFPWQDSSRLAIISSFPTPTASEPNLYGINLK